MIKDGSAVIRKGKGSLPLGTGSKHEDIVMKTFASGKNDGAAGLSAWLDGGDTANLYGTIAIDEKVIIRNEDLVLELTLSGGREADAGRIVKGEWARSHEGEGSRASIDLGGEDASDCGTSCATTDDNNALTGSLGHY